LLSGKKRVKLGLSSPTRDFNYVKDVRDGFIAIAKSDKTIGEEVNIASGQEISIGEVADRIIKKINPEAKIILDSQRIRPKDSEVMRLLGSNRKITNLTSWKPKYSLEKGLNETIKWFNCKENLRLYKSDMYNV